MIFDLGKRKNNNGSRKLRALETEILKTLNDTDHFKYNMENMHFCIVLKD